MGFGFGKENGGVVCLWRVVLSGFGTTTKLNDGGCSPSACFKSKQGYGFLSLPYLDFRIIHR